MLSLKAFLCFQVKRLVLEHANLLWSRSWLVITQTCLSPLLAKTLLDHETQDGLLQIVNAMERVERHVASFNKCLKFGTRCKGCR
jgi:hypothetical protein